MTFRLSVPETMHGAAAQKVVQCEIMKQLTTEMVLQASSERVWELLTDFSLYPHWNSLFPSVTAPGDTGGEYQLSVHLPGMEPFPLKADLLMQEKARLSWQSKLIGRWLLFWKFSYRIEPLSPERLTFAITSEFTGMLAPLFCFGLNRPIAAGMERLSQAVRRWGEKGNVRCLRC